ncbi:MAG TPA: hypothetical protein VIE43_21465 [Thermoanaerobaculia bacterium]|nr:hypothetical protein [Thermoanaerobaculia bacterium]
MIGHNDAFACGISARDAPNAYMGDVMPTILDLYKVKPTTNLDGKSLLVK